MTTPRRVGLLAPMTPELRPLVKRLSLQPTRTGDVELHTATAGDLEVTAIKTGIGIAAAERATEQLLDAVDVDHVVILGVAGGVEAGQRIGDVVVPELVVDQSTGREHRPTPLGTRPQRGTLLTCDGLTVTKADLPALRAQGVVACDMETSAVAAVCERRGKPWTSFRSISDIVEQDLVDQAVFGMAKADGSMDLAAVARYLLPRPWRILRLARLGRDTNTATAAAAGAAIDAIGWRTNG